MTRASGDWFQRSWRVGAAASALLFIALLTLPLAALITSVSWDDFLQAIQRDSFLAALGLSLRTSLISLLGILAFGTPIAWWLRDRRTLPARALSLLIELPLVLPPAVMGIALLLAFGRRSVIGAGLEALGLSLSFSTAAVVITQVIVGAPYYIQAATEAFRQLDADLLLVARTLGASERHVLTKVAAPIALPIMATGASLAWARGLGEFGATLIFAGNLQGVTQTMPLAIYSALESDLDEALALSLTLLAIGALVLLLFRTRSWRTMKSVP